MFERLQPFYGPNSDPFHPRWRDPDSEPLALLYELDRWDKHRALDLTEENIAVTIVGAEQLGIIVPPTPAKLPGLRHYPSQPTRGWFAIATRLCALSS